MGWASGSKISLTQKGYPVKFTGVKHGKRPCGEKMSDRKVKPVTFDRPRHLIGYARVSMADQNPQMQINALVAAGVAPEDVYWEQASGTCLAMRREFQAMMKDVREGDIIVVWKLDRLGRNAAELYATAQQIQATGADLRVLTTPGLDTTTPMGRALFGMLAVFAEFEAEIGRERTMAGLARARAEGRRGGAKAKHSDAAILAFAKMGTKPGARAAGMSVPGFIKAKERAMRSLVAEKRTTAVDAETVKRIFVNQIGIEPSASQEKEIRDAVRRAREEKIHFFGDLIRFFEDEQMRRALMQHIEAETWKHWTASTAISAGQQGTNE